MVGRSLQAAPGDTRSPMMRDEFLERSPGLGLSLRPAMHPESSAPACGLSPQGKTHRKTSDRPGLTVGSWNPGPEAQELLMPGLDNTRLFMSFTAGAGTRCMSLLSSSPSLWVGLLGPGAQRAPWGPTGRPLGGSLIQGPLRPHHEADGDEGKRRRGSPVWR